MKNVAIGVCSVILTFLLVLIIMSTNAKTVRKTEIENALSDAIETALKLTKEDVAYAPQSNDELIADFKEAFFMQIESSTNIQINILAVDYQKGILFVEAIGTFKYPNGQEGSVAVVKKGIVDSYEENTKVAEYTVIYKIGSSGYRTYTVSEGSALIIPPNPSTDGLNFSGWMDEKSGIIYTTNELKSITCSEDREFSAVFN